MSYQPYAALSVSRGRRTRTLPVRTEFQRDRDASSTCAAFRRWPTRPMSSSPDPTTRVPLSHTLEVAQTRAGCQGLAPNEDLTEAISLAMTSGTRLRSCGRSGARRGYRAYDPGLLPSRPPQPRVVDDLERDGSG